MKVEHVLLSFRNKAHFTALTCERALLFLLERRRLFSPKLSHALGGKKPKDQRRPSHLTQHSYLPSDFYLMIPLNYVLE